MKNANVESTKSRCSILKHWLKIQISLIHFNPIKNFHEFLKIDRAKLKLEAKNSINSVWSEDSSLFDSSKHPNLSLRVDNKAKQTKDHFPYLAFNLRELVNSRTVIRQVEVKKTSRLFKLGANL